MTTDMSSVQAAHALCPVCGTSTVPQFRLGDCTVSDCPACGHRFTADAIQEDHVGTVYDDGYFFGGGAGYDDYLVEADLLRAQGRRYGALLARHLSPGRVLDVGAAAGFLQAGLQDAGWDSTGLEPNATMVAHAREKLWLDTVQGSLEDPPDWAPFDAVCLVQVVGHFYDLGRALSSVAKLTRPGGLCLVEYWRRDSVVARLLGRAWHEYSPPSVLHWYTRDSLDAAMASCAFSPVESGAPKKYISGGHARSLLEHKLKQLPLGRILAAPSALVPPQALLRYPAFDLEWRLYRKEETEDRPDGAETSEGDRR